MVAGIGLLAVILDLLSVYLDQTPLSGWLFGLLSLPLITYLALLLARQRQEVAQHARATQEARHQLQQFLGQVSHAWPSPDDHPGVCPAAEPADDQLATGAPATGAGGY